MMKFGKIEDIWHWEWGRILAPLIWQKIPWICVLIFFKKAHVIGTHLNYLNKFIKTCCGYSFELPRLVEAIQMSTHSICYFKEVDNITWTAILSIRKCLTVGL